MIIIVQNKVKTARISLGMCCIWQVGFCCMLLIIYFLCMAITLCCTHLFQFKFCHFLGVALNAIVVEIGHNELSNFARFPNKRINLLLTVNTLVVLLSSLNNGLCQLSISGQRSSHTWAAFQIGRIAGCAYAGNAGNVFLAPTSKETAS